MPSIESPARQPFKEWFNRHTTQLLATELEAAWPRFPRQQFINQVLELLPTLELSQRIEHIAQVLRACLPPEYPQALKVLLRSLPADDGKSGVEGTGGFYFAPHLRFVGRYGLEHYELSMEALYELTKRFSAEFDIRPYLERYPKPTLARLRQWATDPDPRVRRLSSEGSRPRLPWASRLKAFIADPSEPLRILELLKDDPDPVVRRSVANHLNDIAKDHPDRVVQVCRKWMKKPTAGRSWVVRHGLRTLIKAGHPQALELLGFNGHQGLEVSELRLQPSTVRLGGALHFEFIVRNRGDEPLSLSIDYAIHHQKANGELKPKVFKLSRRQLEPGQSVRVVRQHAIRPITTRVYYPGEHRLEVLVNGRSYGSRRFELEVPRT